MIKSLLVLYLLSSCAFPAQEDVSIRVVENGGAGSWKAVVIEDGALPGIRLYAPRDMEAAVAKTTLPVVLFEAEDKDRYDRYLNEIASFGYVVVNAAGQDPDGVLDALRSSPGVFPGGRGDLAAWDRVALVSALGPGTVVPSRTPETVVYLHSSGPRPAVPRLYLTGGLDAAVVMQVQEAFDSDEDAFVAAATYPAGEEGTYDAAFGGSYATLTLQWLEWLLKDKTWQRTIFTGEDCICVYTGWGIQYKNEETVINDSQ
jgi:hypothetical protein